MPRFQWGPITKLAFELVERGIGGQTVDELRQNMTTRELLDWLDWRELKIREQIAAGKQKRTVIRW